MFRLDSGLNKCSYIMGNEKTTIPIENGIEIEAIETHFDEHCRIDVPNKIQQPTNHQEA